ncbi:MAG: hypothetical protein GDA67_14270 [Nitrospira sp. CR1.3]|nr:hypothetical protein [Nitrospira sp. CR1.3]
MRQPLSARQIWGMPVILALISAVGLVSALLGDGIWDVMSWFALAAPTAVVLWSIAHPASHSS